MRNLRFLIVLSLFIFAGLSARQDTLALDEMRIELGDLKHDLHALKVDLNLLEEKMGQQKNTSLLAPIEKKIALLEKKQEKICTDLTSLMGKLEQLELSLATAGKRLDDIGELKTTLSSLSKALKKPAEKQLYRVKSGDSLEKIARTHGTTVEILKKLNDMSGDGIRIGQELKIP